MDSQRLQSMEFACYCPATHRVQQEVQLPKTCLDIDFLPLFLCAVLKNQNGNLAVRSVAGEVVFCTAMMGYPESLTDPSFAGGRHFFLLGDSCEV